MGKPPPITASAVDRGSHEIHDPPLFSDASKSSLLSGNVLEGDLTRLVEKLHQLETKQLKRFVQDLQTALREVALEPSDDLGTDAEVLPLISGERPSIPDEVDRAVEEIAPERSDRFGTDAVMSRLISASVSSISKDIERTATEVEQGPSDCVEPDVVALAVSERALQYPDEIKHATEELTSDLSVPLPVIAAPQSSRHGEMQHPVAEITWEPKDHLDRDAVGSPVISAPVPALPAKIDHVAQEGALQPSARLEREAQTSPAFPAPVSSPANELERAQSHPSTTAVPAQILATHAARTSSRSRSQWRKRTGLLLALSAVCAAIPWELPVLFASFSEGTQTIAEIAVERDAPELSQPGGDPKEIGTIGGTSAPASQTSSRPLPAYEIEGWINRGDQLLGQGDIIAARSFYERAAASGSARAANGVAMTFDPQFLSRLSVVGIRGDPEQAATWYRNASKAAEKKINPHLNTAGGLK